MRNVAWNLVGSSVPLLAALVAVPILLSGLGIERFGVLTIAWALIGYFNLFDFGLGRALTKLAAERLGCGREEEVPRLVHTALTLQAGLGLFAGALLTILAGWLGTSILRIPPSLQEESIRALFLLAACIPMVFLTAGMRAVLDSYHRFDLANLIRIPLGVWTFVGPLIVIAISDRIDHVVWALLLGRVAALLAHAWACRRVSSGLFESFRFEHGLVRPLVSFGGWVTISNVISPIMMYSDRFVIGSMISMAAVAYYTTPYEIIVKLAVLPEAFVGVLFPVFAASLMSNPDRAAKTFDQGVRALLVTGFPVVLIAATLAHEGLAAWLGSDFAARSYRVGQWLCTGMFLNSLARMPFALISASGRPDLIAKVHLIELPLYLGCLWVVIQTHGIEGAAAVWTLRAGLDMLILFLVASKLVAGVAVPSRRGVLLAVPGLGLIAVGATLPTTDLRAGFLLAVLLAFGFYAWKYMVQKEERLALRALLADARGSH